MVSRSRTSTLIAFVLLGGGLVSCSDRRPPDPAKLPVATIDGRVLRVGDLASYLQDNLADAGMAEEAEPGELDQVKSRLFENFVDEEILLFEAKRRGVQISDEELSEYLDAGREKPPGDPGPDEAHRKAARRDLMIQKLRESFVLGEAAVTPEEVDAYMREHGETLAPRPRLVVRSFALHSIEKAQKARREILRRKKTFAQAAAVYAIQPGQAGATEVWLDSLPEDLRAALKPLKPGQVSVPVVVDGTPFLYFLEARPEDETVSEEALRRRAGQDLMLLKYQEASSRLLSELRKRARVELHPENLPFRYVPEPAS